MSESSLLAPDEPSAVTVENPAGRGPVLLTADHAGKRMPRALDSLGLKEPDLSRHIAWDIGIAGVAKLLAKAMDSPAVLQTYSRLVIDCNRRPELPAAYPVISEATPIPGNQFLTEADKLARREAIFTPYHNEIARRKAGKIYIALHSFTPVFLGVSRPMQVALLFNRNPRLSHNLLALLRREGDLTVAENDPYALSDETDYGVPVHAERAGLDYLEIEIRQDLIADERGQAAWAARLGRLLPAALAAL